MAKSLITTLNPMYLMHRSDDALPGELFCLEQYFILQILSNYRILNTYQQTTHMYLKIYRSLAKQYENTLQTIHVQSQNCGLLRWYMQTLTSMERMAGLKKWVGSSYPSYKLILSIMKGALTQSTKITTHLYIRGNSLFFMII